MYRSVLRRPVFRMPPRLRAKALRARGATAPSASAGAVVSGVPAVHAAVASAATSARRAVHSAAGAAAAAPAAAAAAASASGVASAPGTRRTLTFWLNGQRVEETDVRPEQTLLEYLRVNRGLTGSKLGCGEGGCGACSVVLSHWDATANGGRGGEVHRAINACLAPVASVDGHHVITVEGIGSTRGGLHPVQQRMVELHGSQCGFCTPGIVVALYTVLRNNPNVSQAQIEEMMDGNLCRCTGYRPIIDAAKSLAARPAAGACACAAGGVGCCAKPAAAAAAAVTASSGVGAAAPSVVEDVTYPQQTPDGPVTRTCSSSKLANGGNPLPTYAQLNVQELAFPKELVGVTPQPLEFASSAVRWFRPVTLQHLLQLKAKYPDAKLVVGNTEVGVEARFRGSPFPVRIATTHVPELNEIAVGNGVLRFGGSVTLTKLAQTFAALRADPTVAADPAKVDLIDAYATQLKWFSSNQIRNGASIAGNICTASPIADLPPLFLANSARFHVASADGKTRVIDADKFWPNYRTIALAGNEVVTAIDIPWPNATASKDANARVWTRSYKQARRRDDDISIVTAGMQIELKPTATADSVKWTVASIRLGFGGVGKTALRARQTEAFLTGKEWTAANVEQSYALLEADFPLPPHTPGGQTEYRQSLTASFLYKFYVHTALKCKADPKFGALKSNTAVAPTDASAAEAFHRPVSYGRQEYQTSADAKSLVGKDVSHVAAPFHVTGEATYVDDMPSPAPNTLYVGLVLADRAHAELVSVDASAALKADGVAGWLDHRDVPAGSKGNTIGEVVTDEQLFATTKVPYAGQIIGAVLANTHEQAKAAARLVRVTYKDLPAVTNIEQAIEQKSFLGPTHTLSKGDIAKGFAEADGVVEGVVKMGGQEHFYLETNACVAVPGERDTHLYVSSQNPAKNQEWAAHVLGIPSHRVHVHVKRMGGGFGGKETRTTNFSSVAAIAANKFKRPVRINVERDVDMATTGGRHPFLGKYKAGFKKNGQLTAVDLEIFANGGASTDLSIAVLDRALFHSDGTYVCPNFRAVGKVCKTNLPSNTAFRGFGAPQGMFVMESVMDHVQRAVGADAVAVRERNFYVAGQKTHFGQTLEQCNVSACWDQLKREFDLDARRASVAAYNAQNRWRKRGLALVPTKFGISFTAKFMNQGGALVHVYADGSVLLTHGGTEMGQALHTKMLQICAHELGVPLELVHIEETATNTVPNTSPTAASMSSDINGMAVVDACRQLNARLAPLRAKHPNASFKELAHIAYFERINLSAQGFHRVPDLSFDWNTGVGRPFAYFTFGASASEVEVDALTGDHTVRASHVVMDLGKPINPVIDVGQIEGAFTQGQGLFTIEELIFGDREHRWVRQAGALATRGPGAYKLPGFGDVPLDFRVSLLKRGQNPRAIHSSKAVGEPPLFLASSIFFALKDALAHARADAGLGRGAFTTHSPLSSERIRMAALDQHSRRFVAAANPQLKDLSAFQPFGSW